MQPRNPNLSDPYAQYHQHTQYYSHFPTQNPNPYPLQQQHHLQIESQFTSAGIDPAPPGADTYLPSYLISHAGGVTYAQTVGASAPADLLVQNWAAKEAAHQYGNSLYATQGNMVTQDGTQNLLPAIANPTTWTGPTVQPRGPWKKPPKKTKIAQSAWCEVCKIECNTKDVLDQHKLGKKHLKNMEKLKAAATVPPPTHIATVVLPKPIIGPPENPNKENSQKKKKAETPEDLEMKRRKVLEGGAAVNAVRTCTLCNVVCNSDTVFRFHLAGQKHCSMLKKKSQPATA